MPSDSAISANGSSASSRSVRTSRWRRGRRSTAARRRTSRSRRRSASGAEGSVAAADDGEDERLVAPDELAEGLVVPDEEGGDERFLLPALRGHPARDDAQCRPVAFVVHAVRRGHVLQDPLPDRRLKTNPGAGFHAGFRPSAASFLRVLRLRLACGEATLRTNGRSRRLWLKERQHAGPSGGGAGLRELRAAARA